MTAKWTGMDKATLYVAAGFGNVSGGFSNIQEGISPVANFGTYIRASVALSSVPLPCTAGNSIFDGFLGVQVYGMPGATVTANISLSNTAGTQILWAHGLIGTVDSTGIGAFDILPVPTYVAILGTDLTHTGSRINTTAGGVFSAMVTVDASITL